MSDKQSQLNELLRNIILTPEDFIDGKLSEAFYNRIDISDSKKELIKKLLE